jgi:cytochrome c biogenesis protein CcdA/thiol-disulfide isomerase/thioredoxin
VLVLIGIGLVAGLVTALSPCVLPVLPIVLAGGATGRRPLAIIAGLIGSFTVFTLGAAWALGKLGLPDDLLRNIAIALLFLVAATLLWAPLGDIVSRPLERLARRPGGDLGGGVLLGASLGLVFVPCAGPVLAAITVLAATGDVGLDAVVLTLSYAVGAAVPLLAIALLGQRVAGRLKSHAHGVRIASGALIAAAAVAMTLGVDQDLQTRIPGYTESIQKRVESSTAAKRELGELTGAREPTVVDAAADGTGAALPDYGPAPEFDGIVEWQNSPALTITGLRGKVVLIDFWTYSCINCLRTLPYIEDWDRRYRDAGLVVVGVHTPEFAFERVPANVRENSKKLGVTYPVALDNAYGTWNAWGNRYWPAKYLIDRRGHVRAYHFGEGAYDETEHLIRALLAERSVALPTASTATDETPSGRLTPETYLGFERIAGYGGEAIVPERRHTYTLPKRLKQDAVAYGGTWTIGRENAVAGAGARLRLRYRARNVYLVLGGSGTVTALVDGKRASTTRVTGDRLYTLVEREQLGEHLLELRLTHGVAAYAFTFG